MNLPSSNHPKASSPTTSLGPFYALSFRNFRLFFLGQIISVAGTWMQTVAQQWMVWELTHSERWLGYIAGASAIPYVLFSVWGGQTADRYPRRTILLCTQVIAMTLALVLAALASNRWIPLQAWHLAVLAALLGGVNAFNMPAQQAFVSDMVEERAALSNAIALNSLRFNLARVLGPMLAGIALVKVGAVACFLSNGLSYLAVLASLLLMRLPPFQPNTKHLSLWEGFRYIGHTKPILRVTLMVGAGSLLAWPVATLYPVFADRFQVGATGYSRMMSANGLGAMLAGLTLAWIAERFPRRYLIYGGALLFCLALLVFSFAPSYSVALAILIVSGFAMIVFGISGNTRVQESVPDDLRGRVMAVYLLVFNGIMPIGGLLIGFTAAQLGAVAAVRWNALLCLVCLCLTLLWEWKEEKRVLRTE